MTDEFVDKLCAMLSTHEGRKAWMYPDTAGNVTVGVGHMIPSPDAATQLGFTDANLNPAPEEDVVNGWNFVKSSNQEYKALTLADSKINNLLMGDVVNFYLVLIQTFPKFESYPEPAQLGLYDMVFNLGSFRTFPRFAAAVLQQNWASAAAECQREGVGATRNQDTKNQFLECT